MIHVILKKIGFNKSILILFFALSVLTGCKKDWLDAKSDKLLTVPSSLKDLQAILDNIQIMNGTSGVGKVMLSEIGEVSSDNIFVADAVIQSNSSVPDFKWQINAYTFSSDIYEGAFATNISEMWTRAYQRVYYANVVLDELNKINLASGEQEVYNSIKGTALFTRSYMFSRLLEIYSKPYNQDNAQSDLGIPLKLSSDLNAPSVRDNVKNCFDRIINDLKEAVLLLPDATIYKTRPCKATVYALLARVYLVLGDFDNSARYAGECLKLDNKLIEYSTRPATSNTPFLKYNDEVLYSDIRTGPFLLNAAFGRIDMTLFNSYHLDDLRRVLFFRAQPDGLYSFKGSYDGSTAIFYGIAKDEVYLTLSECYARQNKVTDAMRYLNDLLRTRWAKNTNGTTKYVDATASDSADALRKILTERRKELVCRGIRWMDLRRLNKETGLQTTVRHIVNGTTYELLPNSPKYVFPIPDDIIRLTGMPQNQR